MNHSPLTAAYLGPEGTFSHFAAQEFLRHTTPVLQPCDDLTAVFEAVAQGECMAGIVPLENSLRGTVSQSFDLFLNHHVSIIAELYEPISHCLLSGPGQTVNEITSVCSHPQPLAQCGGWLRSHLPGVPLLAVESTGAAARKVKASSGVAAVGHAKLSDLYGLHVLAEGIEDEPDNWTRFVVIAKEPDEAVIAATLPPDLRRVPRERTSLLFTLPDKPGSLAAVLTILAEARINMRKLESRPLRNAAGENWKYAFFVDVECDMTAPDYAAPLGTLCTRTTMLRVLGSYPQGPYLAKASPSVS